MDEQQYKSELDKLESEYITAKNRLHIKFAMAQVKFTVGDIITDGFVTIKVNKIRAHKSLGLPEPVYEGNALKKDLTPKAKNEQGAIYGNNRAQLVKKSNQ